MTHRELLVGQRIWLRCHPSSPWEMWKVMGSEESKMVLEHLAWPSDRPSLVVERDLTRHELNEWGGLVRQTATYRLVLHARPDGHLTDDAGHEIEMRETSVVVQ